MTLLASIRILQLDVNGFNLPTGTALHRQFQLRTASKCVPGRLHLCVQPPGQLKPVLSAFALRRDASSLHVMEAGLDPPPL